MGWLVLGGVGWSGGDRFLQQRVSSLSPVSSTYSMQISFSLFSRRMVSAAASLLVPPSPQHEQLQEAGILNLKLTVWVIYTHSDNKNRQEKETERKSHQVLTEQQKGSMWIFQNSLAGKIWQYSQCTEIHPGLAQLRISPELRIVTVKPWKYENMILKHFLTTLIHSTSELWNLKTILNCYHK